MIFELQPTSGGLFRSPVLYSVYDVNFTEPNFKYTFDIRIWQGTPANRPVNATYTTFIRPETTGRAILNVSRLLDSFLPRTDVRGLLNLLEGFTDTNAVVYVEVVAGYLSDTTPITPLITSDQTYHSRGYSVFTDNATNVTMPDESFLITGNMYNYRNNILTVGIHNNNADILALQVLLKQNGTTYKTYQIPFLPNGDNTNYKLIQFGMDNKTAADLIGNNDAYQLVLYSQSQGIDVDEITVTPIDECKYDPITIYWLNKYGTVQSTPFEKRKNIVNKFVRETYKRRAISPSGVMNLEQGELKNFNSRQTLEETYNTGLREVSDNEMYNDLLASEDVVCLIGDGKITYAIIPKNLAEEERLSVYNKAKIAWTMNFDVSNDYINSIE